jgi:hypothetical protein
LTGLERPNGRLERQWNVASASPFTRHEVDTWQWWWWWCSTGLCKLQYSKAVIQYSWRYSICLNTRLAHPWTHMLAGSSLVEPSSTRFSIDSSVESL